MSRSLSDDEIMETVRVYNECNGNASEAGRRLKMGRKAVKVRVAIASERNLTHRPIETKAGTGRPLNFDEFRNQFDDSLIIPKKIEEGINKFLMKNGEPVTMKEHEFRELCGVPVGKWRRYAESYSEIQIKVPGGTVYWAHPSIADQCREVVNR